MLYQFNPSWGPEVNYYINFILYAVSGNMGGADNIMTHYGDAVTQVASKLHRLKPIIPKEVYRGLLIEPDGLGPGNTISRDPNNTFASFSEDKKVACWFADPKSAMSMLVRMQRPKIEGWIVNTTPKKKDILFHWTWGLKFPFRGREVGFDTFMRMHPEFATMSSIEKTIRSQKEVILKPTEEIFTATAFKDAGCPTTRELDVIFSDLDPRSRRNPERRYHHNPDEDLRTWQRLASQGDQDATAKWVNARYRLGEIPLLHLEIAAQLRYPIALQLLPRSSRSKMSSMLQRPLVWDGNAIRVIFEMLLPDHQTLVAKIAATYAQRVLPWFEAIFSNDIARKAILATIAWANDPSGANRLLGHDSGDEIHHNQDIMAWNALLTTDDRKAAIYAALAAYSAALTVQREDASFGAAQAATRAMLSRSYGEMATLGLTLQKGVGSAGMYTYNRLFNEIGAQEEQWQTNFLAEVLLGLRSPDLEDR